MEKINHLLKQAESDDCLTNWGDNFEAMIKMLASGENRGLQILD